MRIIASMMVALCLSVLPAQAVYFSDGNVACTVESPQGTVGLTGTSASFTPLFGEPVTYRLVKHTAPAPPRFFKLSHSFKKTLTIHGVTVVVACSALNQKGGGECAEAKAWGHGNFSLTCTGCAQGQGVAGLSCKRSNVQFIRQL